MSLGKDTNLMSDEYTTAEFRKSMATAFETARYQDSIVRVNHHGRPWVAIVSPENAASISRLNSVGKLGKQELGKVIESLESEVEVNELLDRISALRDSGQ